MSKPRYRARMEDSSWIGAEWPTYDEAHGELLRRLMDMLPPRGSGRASSLSVAAMVERHTRRGWVMASPKHYPSWPIGNYLVTLTDGHGQWFGLTLDRFEPSRQEAKSVRALWCLGFPWYRITYSDGPIQAVQRKPRIWLTLRNRLALRRWRLQMQRAARMAA